MRGQARMAEQPYHVTRHRILVGLVVLVVEFQKRLFPGSVAAGQQGMGRRDVIAVEESDGVEKVDGLDKGPALRENAALVLECDGVVAVLL